MSGKQNKKAHTKQKINKDVVAIPNWALPALLVFTAILYSKAAFCSLTSFDDDFYVTNNPAIRDFSLHGVKTIFTSYYVGHYQPITMLVYLVVYKFFELNPVSYHLLNVLIHLVNIALVFKLTQRLSGQSFIALVVAILFALHPLNVQSVVWVSELKNVSYASFYLLSLLVYLRYLSSGYRLVYYTGVAALFLVSLLCKSAAVTLPVLLFVIDFYKGRKLSFRSIAEKTPLVALSIVFGVIAIISQREAGAHNALMVSYGPVNGFFMFTSGIAFYFTWLLAPVWLCTTHYFPALKNGFLPWIYYLSLPVVLSIAWMVVRKNVYRKEIWFGVAFFFVAISVMLQIVSVGSGFVSEHYPYIAYIGLFYIIGILAAKYIQLDKFKGLALSVFLFYIIIFSVIIWNRIDVWKNDYTLFNDLVEKNPNVYFGYWLRGNAEKIEGNLNPAFADYSKAIELNPTFEDAYFTRGRVNSQLGNLKAAVVDYTTSIKLNPKQADSYNNRGWIYYQTGNKNAAMDDYRKAVSIKPLYAEALNNIGWAYDQAGVVDSALENYTKAIAAQPDFKKPMYNIAALKARLGDLHGAVNEYNLLINLSPKEDVAYLLRGNAFKELNDMQNACTDWQKAMELGNKYAGGLIKQYCH